MRNLTRFKNFLVPDEALQPTPKKPSLHTFLIFFSILEVDTKNFVEHATTQARDHPGIIQ